MKQCPACGHYKPEILFQSRLRTAYGYCNDCEKDYQKRYRERFDNPKAFEERVIMRKKNGRDWRAAGL